MVRQEARPPVFERRDGLTVPADGGERQAAHAEIARYVVEGMS